MSAPRDTSEQPHPPAPLPEPRLDEDTRQKLAHSCPGDTFFPGACLGDADSVINAWVTEAELTGRADSYLGKRKHPRYTWNATVLVRVHARQFAGKVIRARAKNISLGGVGIQMRSVVRPGTFVEIMVEGRPFGVTGTVAHCTKTFSGTFVGIAFSEP